MAKNEIRAVSGIMVNGQFTQIKDLPKESREAWRAKALKTVGKTVGTYLNDHPDELAVFVKQPGVTVIK